MIDTDKYEGHTPAPWTITNKGIVGITEIDNVTLHVFSGCYSETDACLITDAPLLLAEVKRLRDGIWNLHQFALDCVGSNIGDLYETIADDLRRLIE